MGGGIIRPLSPTSKNPNTSAGYPLFLSINSSTSKDDGTVANAEKAAPDSLGDGKPARSGKAITTRRQRSRLRPVIPNVESRKPNPFEPIRKYLSFPQFRAPQQSAEPWGVKKVKIPEPQTDRKDVGSVAKIDLNGFDGRVPTTPNSVTLTESKSQLTHLTSSGEAHMVDVGAKPATRRVAIAFAVVRFTNTEPFRLIFENQNQKGDVLGVARIAGIMASKQTSSIIPLCHPININKVEVDVNLGSPGRVSRTYSKCAYGSVYITAHVECHGPTGVEMEALNAATASALTVYDMCKAVDRAMIITMARVVYKSGGRSGLHIHRPWREDVGQEFFLKRGLETQAA
jgi:molybdenum cofactor biosynthesis protein MoaC